MLRLYQRIGFQVQPIGEPRIYWGEERLPCLFDPVAGFTRPGSREHIPLEKWAPAHENPGCRTWPHAPMICWSSHRTNVSAREQRRGMLH